MPTLKEIIAEAKANYQANCFEKSELENGYKRIESVARVAYALGYYHAMAEIVSELFGSPLEESGTPDRTGESEKSCGLREP